MSMIAYHPGNWISFFSATTGAAAALAGLVIVAISVNITRILEHSHLPASAAATIASLILVLVTSMAVLLPGQTTVALGWEAVSFGLPVGLLQLWAAKLAKSARIQYNRPAYEWGMWMLVGQLQVLPFILGGISLIAGSGGGLYWLAAGTIAAFIFSMLSTWVLLIEILR
jgi:hypothetical protein